MSPVGPRNQLFPIKLSFDQCLYLLSEIPFMSVEKDLDAWRASESWRTRSQESKEGCHPLRVNETGEPCFIY